MATKKTAPKTPAKQETLSTSVEELSNQLRDAAVASLGLYGKVYDEVQDRVDPLRKDVPKQWNTYVKRGEKLQKEVNQAIDDADFSISVDIKEKRDQLQHAIDKVTILLTPTTA